MFSKGKKDLLAKPEKGENTPKSSRKVVAFSKWLTQSDQIALVERDMADGHRFAVVRHKLSGGEARGTLVVGSTALTFLNKEDKIVFVHPYRVIQRYCVNERKQFQYAFEMTGSKTLIYAFDTDEAAAIVAHIDRNSLRLEKTFADADKGGTGASAGAAPPTAISLPLFDAVGEAAAASTAAPEVGSKKKVGSVEGLRFNVKVVKDRQQQRVVAIVNQDGIILIDPSSEKSSTSQVAYQRFPWPSIVSTHVSDTELTISTSIGHTTIISPDAHSLLEEINRQAILGGKANLMDANEHEDEDTRAVAVANAIVASVTDKGIDEPQSSSGSKSPRAGSKNPMFSGMMNHVVRNVKTRDYAPEAFVMLRRKYRIDPAEYAQEWDAAHNPRRRELTPGLKSRWIVQSRTAKYVAVELTSSECDALCKFLEEHVRYVSSTPGTLLMRLIGLHRVSVFSLHVAVFVNPIPPGIPATPAIYDLHGSGLRVAPPEARGQAGAHLLDRDFILDHRTVFLPYRECKVALLALAKDAAHLAQGGFCDFTLQVTVSPIAEGSVAQVQAWVADARARGYGGLFVSPLEDELYTVAITNMQSREADKEYAQTFCDQIKRRVITFPDPTLADLEWEKANLQQPAAADPPKSPRGK